MTIKYIEEECESLDMMNSIYITDGEYDDWTCEDELPTLLEEYIKDGGDITVTTYILKQ